jgi:RPA family protein
MTEKTASQAQQSVRNPWTDVAERELERMEAFTKELERLERENAERAQKAVDEMARLTKESIEHAMKLTDEWRRLAMETWKRSADAAGAMRFGG